MITRDGSISLLAHAYLGNKPDVSQRPLMIDALGARRRKLAGAAGVPGGPEVTVVFDAGQNSAVNFSRVTETGLEFLGVIPPSDVPDPMTTPRRTVPSWTGHASADSTPPRPAGSSTGPNAA